MNHERQNYGLQSEESDPGAILARFASDLRAETLPDEITRKLKHLFVDTVGVILGAVIEAHVQQARGVVLAGNGASQAALLGTTFRSNVQEAAFANGVAAHAIDFDDTHKFVHPGCAVVPAVLALAEERDLSGSEFLSALAAGYEVGVRVSLAAGVEHRNRGFHPTGTCNVFGAAAGAGRAIGLGPSEMAMAIGAASSMACGTTQYRMDGAANKHLHGGLAARSGVLSALLAEQGFRGTAHALDGELAFLQLYSDGGSIGALTNDLGQRFELLDTDFKPYPSCRQSHAPVDLAIEASKTHNLSLDEIETVTVYTYSYANKPWYTDNMMPDTPLEALLRIPYCVSSALLHGCLGLQQFTGAAIKEPQIEKLIGRVTVETDTRFDLNWPDERAARLRIRMTDGSEILLETTNPLGSSEKPMSLDDILRKFHALASSVLSERQRENFVHKVEDLENRQSIRDLIQELIPS